MNILGKYSQKFLISYIYVNSVVTFTHLDFILPHIFLQVVRNLRKSDLPGITLRSNNIVQIGDDNGSFVIVQV